MTRSLDMQNRARRRIPGLTQLLSKRPDRFSSGVWPGYFSKAKGARVWDLDGREYLDMSIGGIGACVLGYADDEVDDAVVRAIRDGVASSLNCPEEVELADLLCKLHPWADKARFFRSGGEAMSMAVRIARAHTGRDIVAFCGYHGCGDWYLAANLGKTEALDGHLMAGLAPAGVPRALRGTALPFRYNALEELEDIAIKHGRELAAIVMEPIRNAMPAPGFFESVRAVADKTGAVFLMDEISAGFRYCPGGAHLALHSVTPDMAVFSKALGNGYAVSAVIGITDVMDSAQKTFLSSTNWTERVGPTAALACVTKYYREKAHETLNRLGSIVKNGWVDLGIKHGLPVHSEGIDAMGHFSLAHSEAQAFKAFFVQEMMKRGILSSTHCYIMATHTEEDVYRYLAACDEVFATGAELLKTNDLRAHLEGQPAASGFTRLA